MNFRIYVYSSVLVCFIILVVLIGACSGGKNNPLMPDAVELQKNVAPREYSTTGGHMLWGMFTGHANIEERVFELTPLRAADLHLNLVPTADQLSLVGVKVCWGESNLAQGRITVDITLNNPFSDIPKFAGFDVRGILISGASMDVAPGLQTSGDAHPRLLNPDGYTRWWNPVEFTDPGVRGYDDGKLGTPNSTAGFDAEINAYKIFADALSNPDTDPISISLPDVNAPTGRAVFHTASNTRRYELRFPPGDSYFNYAIDASWAPPVSTPPDVPDDFPTGANSREAWLVGCEISENTLEYDAASGQCNGNLALEITVYDWQGRINGTTAPEVSEVNIYSPGLFGTQVGHGTMYQDLGDTARYSANLTYLCVPSSAGTYTLGVEVVSANGNYKQSTFAAPDEPPASYMLVDIEISEGVPGLLSKTFGIKAWVLRRSDGTSPAISDDEIAADIAYADEFWSRYGFGIELAERSFIDSDLCYNLSTSDTHTLYELGHDSTGLVNLYYVNSIVGHGGAYASIPCLFPQATGVYSQIVFDASDNDGLDEVLTHELGHSIGMLADEYLLDQGYTCEDLSYLFCAGVSDVYCHPSLNVWGNMMYFIDGSPDTPVSFYNISDMDIGMSTPSIDSQAENVSYFHSSCPLNFKDMEVS